MMIFVLMCMRGNTDKFQESIKKEAQASPQRKKIVHDKR